MAWTTPVDQTTGHLVTAAEYNAQIIDNLAFLHGDAGTIDVSGGHNQLKADNILVQPNAGSGAYSLQSQIAADTNPRLGILSGSTGGAINFGPGNAAVDAQIFREAAGILALRDPGGSGTGNWRFGYQTTTGGATTWNPSASVFMNRYNMNATGTLTIGAPFNAPGAAESAVIIIVIQNASGGVITLAWNAAYVNTGAAPANGQGVLLPFVWNSGTSKWVGLPGVAGLAQ